MAIEQVKTINELERIDAVSDNAAFAVSTGQATFSATAEQNKDYLKAYLESLENKVNNVESPSATTYPSTQALVDYVRTAVYSAGNIGDIKYTTMTKTPYGGAWCDGATYTQSQFPSVYDMLVDGTLASLPIAEYDNMVTASGSCGLFGLDTATASFKVPTLTNVYVKAGQTAAGFGAESLPNIKSADGDGIGGRTAFAAGDALPFTYISHINSGHGAGNQAVTGPAFGFNASTVNSTYQDGAKVNPEHVVYRAYVVLYANAIPASVAQTEQFLESLALKAGVDFENVSAAGKEQAVGWGMPDYSAVISQNQGVQYTAPTAGILYLQVEDYNTSSFITIDGVRMLIQRIVSNQASSTQATYLVGKGSVYIVNFAQPKVATQYILFVPLKGVK